MTLHWLLDWENNSDYRNYWRNWLNLIMHCWLIISFIKVNFPYFIKANLAIGKWPSWQTHAKVFRGKRYDTCNSPSNEVKGKWMIMCMYVNRDMCMYVQKGGIFCFCCIACVCMCLLYHPFFVSWNLLFLPSKLGMLCLITQKNTIF